VKALPQTRPAGFRIADRQGLVVLAVVFSLLVACTGGPAATDAATSTASALPGTKEFGLTDEEFATTVESVQSLIASCIADAGFEYIPADVQTVEMAMAAVRAEPGMSEELYTAQWGFGITTRFDNRVKEIELGPQNVRILEGLSAADRVAYERTLYGEDPDATFAFAFDEEDFGGTGGCTREAVEQSFTEEQLSGNYANPKDILVEQDPRVVEAQANWVECMADAGYDYLDQDDIIDEYQERLSALVGEDDPEGLTGPRADQLRELQAEEIAVALADLECETQHTTDVIRQVEIEVFGAPET